MTPTDHDAIKHGDYFLLPFAGNRIDLLVQAVAPGIDGQHWEAKYAKDGHSAGQVLLTSCRRCPPSLVARILKTEAPADTSATPDESMKPVKGYEGLYYITADGRVLSTPRRQKARWLVPPPVGYAVVRLHKDGVGKTVHIHRLLAEHWIPNPDGKPQVNHINGIKNDNRIENLEWVTCSENITHAWKTGLFQVTEGRSRNGRAALRVAQLKHVPKIEKSRHPEILAMHRSGVSQTAIANRLGVTQGYISRICHAMRKAAT